MPVSYQVLRVLLACFGGVLVFVAVVPWLAPEGFFEPDELARPVTPKALTSLVIAFCGLLLLIPHRWTSHGPGYVLKLTALVSIGSWMLVTAASALSGYLLGTKHWLALLAGLVLIAVAVAGPVTLVWRARANAAGTIGDRMPN
jgi:hypothetical protein